MQQTSICIPFFILSADEFDFDRDGVDDPKIISRIANELDVVLKLSNRILKIVYPTNGRDWNVKDVSTLKCILDL